MLLKSSGLCLVVARRYRTEACGIVAGRIAYSTGTGGAVPDYGVCQRLGNLGAVAAAHILVLAA